MALAVDAYAAQHHGAEGRRQAQSVWVHLVSLCAILERGYAPMDGIRVKQDLLRDDPVFAWLAPPADPGSVTVSDVAATTGEASPAAVLRWAASVWDAWSDHHEAVRNRTDEYAPRRG